MPRHSKDTVAVLGIDIGKNTFLVGLNKRGAIVLRQKLSRRQLEARVANLPPCLIGMEACVGAHHLSRRLKAFGHRLRPTVERPSPRAGSASNASQTAKRRGSRGIGRCSTATRTTLGAISLSSSSHFAPRLYSNDKKPVALPPGRPRLST